MFMESSDIVSRPRGVILTVRKAVFICGLTDAIEPWTIVPVHVISTCLTAGPEEVNYHS